MGFYHSIKQLKDAVEFSCQNSYFLFPQWKTKQELLLFIIATDALDFLSQSFDGRRHENSFPPFFFWNGIILMGLNYLWSPTMQINLFSLRYLFSDFRYSTILKIKSHQLLPFTLPSSLIFYSSLVKLLK